MGTVSIGGNTEGAEDGKAQNAAPGGAEAAHENH